jgi:hypothetical protein
MLDEMINVKNGKNTHWQQQQHIVRKRKKSDSDNS